MRLIKEGTRLFTISGIADSKIVRTDYKVPRELLKVYGILPVTFAASIDINRVTTLGYLTLQINGKKVNPMQRFNVQAYQTIKRKYVPLKLDEEIESGSIITAIYEDTSEASAYTYNVTVYLTGLLELNIPS